MKQLIKFFFALLMFTRGVLVHAESVEIDLPEKKDKALIQISILTHHYERSDEHKNVYMIGYENESKNGELQGITFFRNSFGQPTLYIYPWGQKISGVFSNKNIYLKYSYGLLYGYKGKYEDKVPLNKNGFSPAFIPAIGYDEGHYQIQVNALGIAGLMIQFNFLSK